MVLEIWSFSMTWKCGRRWQGGTQVLVRRMSSGKGNPPTFCREIVRTTDHEHYIATLLLPDKLRTATFAIRALGSEIAGVRDSVSDRTLGMVRTQFWKDAVTSMYEEGKTVPNHPVVTEVKRLVDASRPSKKLLQVTAIQTIPTFKFPFRTLLDHVTPSWRTDLSPVWSRWSSMEKQLFLASILSFWKLWATIVDMLSMQLRNLASVRVLSHCSEEPLTM